MLKVRLNEIDGIALLEPDGKLSKEDFESAAARIDPYIEQTGKLNGIIIYVKEFPGWDSFAGLVSHMKFVKNHHKKITHVALVTDSPLGEFAEHIASHFVNAEVKHFAYSELDKAKEWALFGEND